MKNDGQIKRSITLEGCEIEGGLREKLRVNSRLTNCETGDILVISKMKYTGQEMFIHDRIMKKRNANLNKT